MVKSEKKQKRSDPVTKELARICIDRLKKDTPAQGCTLDYDHAYQQLLVSIAAGGTVHRLARVNVVVQDLFARYPSVEALAAAEPEEIQAIVKPCGLGRSKAPGYFCLYAQATG